jgi:hypothetical protein
MADNYWRDFPPPALTDFDALARYNAERSRGIQHHPAWVARMAEVQEHFNFTMTMRAARAAEDRPSGALMFTKPDVEPKRRRRWWS